MFLIKKIRKYIIQQYLNQLFFKQVGFTLMEMLTSMFIMVFLLSIFLVNYHGTNERTKLVMDAQKLASNIRLMQSYTLGLQEFKGSVPAGGWGIRMGRQNPLCKHYILFADGGNDPDEANHKYDSGEEFKTIYFSDGVQVKDKFIILKPFGAGTSEINIVDIVFEPPDPFTYICCIPPSNYGANAEIELENIKDGSSKKINVNFLGLVDIVD